MSQAMIHQEKYNSNSHSCLQWSKSCQAFCTRRSVQVCTLHAQRMPSQWVTYILKIQGKRDYFLLRAFVVHSIPCKKSMVVVSNVYYIVKNSLVNYNVSQSAFRVTSIQNTFPNLSSIQLYHSQPKIKILNNLICVLLNLQSLKHWKLNP